MTVYGTAAKHFEPVREAFANAQANDPGGAQLCIYRHGEVVVDLWTGRDIALGPVRGQVFKSIVRCAATHVDPATAVRDIEVTKALFDAYGHMHCGIYLNVTRGGAIAVGDACAEPAAKEVCG